MEIISSSLIIVGFIISLVFGLQLLIMAFKESVLWGLGYIFIPFVALVFVIIYWSETKKPFLLGLLGIPFIIIGIILAKVVVH